MIKNTYAVIKTEKLEETSQFYEKYFGFERAFDSDWYVSLKSGSSEMAVLNANHETLPEKFRGKATGTETLLNFEMDDVDGLFKDFQKDGKMIHLTLRDEPWGQRHFITEDPNGIAIDIIKVIPPSEAFLKQYA